MSLLFVPTGEELRIRSDTTMELDHSIPIDSVGKPIELFISRLEAHEAQKVVIARVNSDRR